MTRSPRRYVSAGAAPGRRTASSARRTNGAPESGSAYTATVAMPRSCAVRMTRAAISPRLATSNFVIIGSHPEDAEATPALDTVGGDRGQRHPEHVAGVAGVDDAVVVEPRGDGEGV